jgi:hypothetical protein
MLCTPWLRNPLTTSRLSCLGRKAALTTIFLSVRQSRISQPCYTNNYFIVLNRIAPKIKVFGNKKVNKSEFFTTSRQYNILHRNFSRLARQITLMFNVSVNLNNRSLTQRLIF